MTVSLFEVTVPVLQHGLQVLGRYIDVAADSTIDIPQARLAPDMLPFAGQIQRASDTAKGAIKRLTDRAVPAFEDNERTLAELRERIAKTQVVLESVAAADFGEDRMVDLQFGPLKGQLTASGYVLQLLLPNFFFHVATAHNILRHNGLPVGKLDYLGELQGLRREA